MDKISVIVPCYNVALYIRRCVDSIIDQTYRDLEIILVDDGSTDETGKLCDDLLKLDPRIKVVHKENGGLSDARNAGIDEATGEYYSFVDADDYLELDAYENMIAEMKSPEISLISAGIVVEDLKGNRTYNMNEQCVVLNREEAFVNLFGSVRTIGQSSCNKLFRKQLFCELRYKRGIVNEDMELLPKLLDLCNQVVLLNKPVYHYVRREGSITESEFSMWKYQGAKIPYDALTLCREKYQHIVPYAHYYVMDSLFKLYRELISSRNRGQFQKEEHSLRFRIVREYFFCLIRRSEIRECMIKVKNMAIVAILGIDLNEKLISLKNKILKK